MGDPFRKVSPGDPLVIPAAAYNTFVDTARDYLDRRNDQGQEAHPAARDSGIVLVRNDAGEDVTSRFAVLGIDGPVIAPADNADEFANRVILSGKVPYVATHAGRFIILLEPLAAGAIGYGVVSGVTAAKVDVADEDHAFADVENENWSQLKSGATGAAQILWKESGTGYNKWALVRLGNPAGAGTVFPVNLTQVGGSQGTTTAPASWTYDVVDAASGATLATAVNPTASPHKWKRPSAGWMIAATFGYAHYNADAQLVLGWINEVAEQEACSS